MKKCCTFYFLLFMMFVPVAVRAQTSFTPGNFVVCRIGNGTVKLSTLPGATNAQPVYLDEFTPTGSLVQTISLPSTNSSSSNALTLDGASFLGGLISLSSDGQYIVVAGYNAASGTASVGSSSSTTIARTIATVKYDATINTSTALTDFSSAGNPICAVSSDGTNFWLSGSSASNNTGGIRYTTFGSTTSTSITANGVYRCLNINVAQLYLSQNSAPRLAAVGSGLPTAGSQTITSIPGFSDQGQTIGQFSFFDLDPSIPGVDVLYVANDASTGGLQKFSLFNGNWISNGKVGTGTDKYTGLCGMKSGNSVILFATTIGTNSAVCLGGNLVTITDSGGYNNAITGTPSVLSSIATRFGTANYATYRGVTLVPQQGALPVTITDFTGYAASDINILNWNTATESNNAGFEVERSVNGSEFTKIGFVASKTNNGNSSVNLSYDFKDAHPPTNKLFYRLKQVDKDGKSSYSKIAIIDRSNKGSVIIKSVFPNPAGPMITLNIEAQKGNTCYLVIYDAIGRKVSQRALSIQAGSSTINVDASAFSKGVFNISLVNSSTNETISRSFIKE